ncbi:YlzJ-like family protein [Bacillus sp. B15-48]|uniref:YlzJ-like family protein n=1 Tax=Bacillus sp. B15-48 TaxID=1548601 RepID=UPI0019400334|nr:YlzJ-like family protein [Bacillus sp. B15-48]MBM4763908.1 ribonuclease [Bacillus sp. B15-48]
MILYTMMPQELIFPEQENQDESQLMLNYKGIQVLAEQEDARSYRIVRVMSTDPSHYLNPDYTPGTKISFS